MNNMNKWLNSTKPFIKVADIEEDSDMYYIYRETKGLGDIVFIQILCYGTKEQITKLYKFLGSESLFIGG